MLIAALMLARTHREVTPPHCTSSLRFVVIEVRLPQRMARFSRSARLLIIRKGFLMLILFRTASSNGRRLAPSRIASILTLWVGVTIHAVAQSPTPATAPVGTAGIRSSVASEQSVDAAAKDAAQNPVAAAISVPFQNNTYYGAGPYRRAENELLVEPVLPFTISSNWIMITRTIIPVEVMPRLSPTESVDYGLGNIQPQIYFSPAHPGHFIWGTGGEIYLPTATDRELGTNKWGGGPATVGLYHQGPWLGGALVSNAFAGVNHTHVNEMTLNPFLFYNMKRGWYFFSSPIITSDWAASRDHRWTVPVGGGAGRVFKLGKQPLNARAEFLNNVQTTSYGPSWQLQTQLQFVFIRQKK